MTVTDLDIPTGVRETQYPDPLTIPNETVDEAIDALEETEFGLSYVDLPIPTREQCIEAIIRETNCDHADAQLLYEFIGAIVSGIRAFPGANEDFIQVPGFDGMVFNGIGFIDAYHLGDIDLVTVHPLLDVIMPDYQTAAYGSGSAHDLLERAHLDTAKGEFGLMHGKSSGKVENCTVSVQIYKSA